MTRDEFAAIVRRLESFAAAHPRAYHLRVAAFGLLGYAYVVAVLVGLTGLAILLIVKVSLAGYVAAKLALAVLALIFLVVGALWVRLPPPPGRLLVRPEAPALFDLIDEVVENCGAPRPNTVLLSDDFNAGITQRRRRVFFGGTANHLIIGLPMLQAVTAAEFRAILAHECGHLSGGHGTTGAWIYRLRAGWSRLAEALEAEQHWGRWFFLGFFRWYAPQFAAYSFVAAREQEYAADRMSAEVTSPALAGQALVRVALTGRHLRERYWPAVGATVRSSPTPPPTAFTQLRESLRNWEFPDGTDWLSEALGGKTGVADTHPSLADRLAALGVPAVVPPPLERSASDELLDQAGVPLTTEADAQWASVTADTWKKRHEEYTETVAKHAALLVAEAAGELAVEGRRELAALEESVGNPERARERYESLLAELPDDAPIIFTVGRLRLGQGDESGVELLRRAVSLDAGATPAVTMILARWFKSRGDEAALRDLLRQYDAYQESIPAARPERTTGRGALRHLAIAGVFALITVAVSVFSLLPSLSRLDTADHDPTHERVVLGPGATKTFWGITLGEDREDVERAKGKPLKYENDIAIYSAAGPGDDALVEIDYVGSLPDGRRHVRGIYYLGDRPHAPGGLPFINGLTAEQLADRFGFPVWSRVPNNDAEFEMFRSGLTAYVWHRETQRYGIQADYLEP